MEVKNWVYIADSPVADYWTRVTEKIRVRSSVLYNKPIVFMRAEQKAHRELCIPSMTT